jgi:2-succinyl-5-enolpyruvyl-6-hydroxy-3-cyclohexene-1-carboxylate synthase
MQVKVNRNYFWSTILIDQLVECGVKYACLSPGSRSTPLTYAVSQNKKIKSYIIVDERTSGFFALGIAKQTKSPVLIITTSGTATAELYPAIIEAYQNRVPLIICTADRPAYLRNTGANQTINQDNIYKNHIRFFYDAGLPKLAAKNIKSLKENIVKAFKISALQDCGPVHLNFPFEKPLEPDSITDAIDENIVSTAFPIKFSINKNATRSESAKKYISAITFLLKKNCCGVITVGPGNFSNNFINLLENFSSKFALPIFADASSGLAYRSNSITNLITNFDTILRTESFSDFFSPKLNFHFGRTATSPRLAEFLTKSKCKRFIVNRFGDRIDSSKNSTTIKTDEEVFLKSFVHSDFLFEDKSLTTLNQLKSIDAAVEKIKISSFLNYEKLNEPAILLKILEAIPPDSNLMISNSIPIRDLDFFSSALNKNIIVYQNRGASGIDGITSTALGICAHTNNPTYLIIGDLSFYYDINSLLIAKQYKIPLIIILINNEGGSIFRFLPIANYKNVFEKFFLAPTNLSFKKLAEAFDADYKELKSYQDVLNHIKVSSVRKTTAVYEIKTNSEYSLSVRKKYWVKVNKFVAKFLRNYEN